MSDEPSHQAMLYFLEVLMNSSGQLSISQLAGRFGSANFSQEMRNASGGNEAGLKQFLARYPSLFTIRGNTVSLCDGREDEEDADNADKSLDNKNIDTTSEVSRNSETSSDAEAVEFFRNQMLKRDEFWIPIKSLAGHLSQTTNEIRNMVGPQLEFKKWLQSHPNTFNVDGDNVSLRDSKPLPSPAPTRRITFDLGPETNYNHVPPKTPPPQRKTPRTPSSLYRSQSIGDKLQNTGVNGALAGSVGPPKTNNTPIVMSAAEYKTIMKLKELLEKKGRTKVLALAGCLCSVADTILGSCTAPELESFVLRFPEIFILTRLPNDASCIELVKNAKLSVVVTGNAGRVPNSGTTRSGRGQIFHVARLWGIVDLGEHEHVFFDKSILPIRPGQPAVEDMQTRFKVGEWLNFEAVMAHKSSRARWRAVSVWKDDEASTRYGVNNSIQSNQHRSSFISPDGQIIEDEVNEFLPKYKSGKSGEYNTQYSNGGNEYLLQYNGSNGNNEFMPQLGGKNGVVNGDRKIKMVSFEDALPSGAGAVPIWNFKQDESKDRPATMCLVPEAYQMSVSALSDLKFAPNLFNSFLLGGVNRPMIVSGSDGGSKDVGPRFVNVGCQTVSTGDIIATQLYQDA